MISFYFGLTKGICGWVGVGAFLFANLGVRMFFSSGEAGGGGDKITMPRGRVGTRYCWN